jgi:hypothetical protein
MQGQSAGVPSAVARGLRRPCDDPLQHRVCEQTRLRYPIIQTAMGWVARPELVAASCNAGAFGFLRRRVMSRTRSGPRSIACGR